MGIGTHSAVQVEGQKFDVETEARGGERPVIDTTVYSKGRVIYRRVKSYDDLLGAMEPNVEALQQRVDSQHRDVVQDLKSGALKFGETGPLRNCWCLPHRLNFRRELKSDC